MSGRSYGMPAKGKKFSKSYTDSKTGRKRTVSYGAKGYSISPGTSKGDNYCARSYGINKQAGYDCSGKDKNKPNCLSRAKWHCKGKKSMKESAMGRLPGRFDRTHTTVVKCPEGFVYVRPDRGGSRFQVSGSGFGTRAVGLADVVGYVREICQHLGGCLSTKTLSYESVSAAKIVRSLLED